MCNSINHRFGKTGQYCGQCGQAQDVCKCLAQDATPTDNHALDAGPYITRTPGDNWNMNQDNVYGSDRATDECMRHCTAEDHNPANPQFTKIKYSSPCIRPKVYTCDCWPVLPKPQREALGRDLKTLLARNPSNEPLPIEKAVSQREIYDKGAVMVDHTRSLIDVDGWEIGKHSNGWYCLGGGYLLASGCATLSMLVAQAALRQVQIVNELANKTWPTQPITDPLCGDPLCRHHASDHKEGRCQKLSNGVSRCSCRGLVIRVQS
jgi:hypothetical protein